MIDQFKSWLLKVLRVPMQPEPPAGAPESVRVFRAAPNYFRMKLMKWGLAQAATLIGILAFLPFVWSLDLGRAGLPLRLLETLALAGFVIQLPFTFLLVRFDYELRWYIVTDRSLRIRYGIQQVREMTMSFANIQQITLQQGPLQRLLGIADLQVRTAGGGSGDSPGQAGQGGGGGYSMHLGYFRGVANAPEIRDLMLARLRQWKDSGLGDPDEPVHREAIQRPAEGGPSALKEATRQLLAEARALRLTLEPSAVELARPVPGSGG